MLEGINVLLLSAYLCKIIQCSKLGTCSYECGPKSSKTLSPFFSKQCQDLLESIV